ncbi:MAG: 4Fe-4S dicluster domain-containing protein [Candidatus Omnitrophota bacterium]|jgi:formate dehydrogenase iron-sulfur subunit|nr:MAG: 4Fe-4S dicluster domain-containing protein [Candidatus Omnitrophota bacterium]
MKSILTDITKCIGCNECVLACKRTYDLPPELPRRWHKPDGLSARNWTSIVRLPENKFVRKQCRHCQEPACVSACPVGALIKNAEGPVTYDGGKCMGCRYCMMACPYEIPRYDWDSAAPYIRKCILCYERIKEGKQPACTEACPTGATIFGEREELLAEAKRRRQENPKLQLYGDENEIGGTCVLYVSDVDLKAIYNGRDLRGDPALPSTTAPVLASVPLTFVGVGVLMSGLYWTINRREQLKKEGESGEKANG